MSRVAEILTQLGRNRAEMRAAGGAAKGAFIRDLGQLPVQIRQAARQARRDEFEERKQAGDLEYQQAQIADMNVRRQAAAETAARLGKKEVFDRAVLEFGSLHGAEPQAVQAAIMKWTGDKGIFSADEAQQAVSEAATPEGAARIVTSIAGMPKRESLIQRDPTRALVDPVTGKEISPAAPKEPEKPKPIGTPITALVNGRPAFVQRMDDGSTQVIDKTTGGLSVAPQPEKPAGGGAKRWVRRGKDVVLISDAEYRPGDIPVSEGKESVLKSVTSGDAGRFAELDSSLDLLGDVRGMLSGSPRPGILSRAAASTPYVTELTGAGTGAKKRQALVDLSRQIIGKALEGGVLRKEDEEKYENILVTLNDPDDVARAKLDGLEKTVKQKRERELDAREDAGYDVSRFRARTPVPAGATAGAQSKVVQTPQGPMSFDTAEQAAAFRKKTGLR